MSGYPDPHHAHHIHGRLGVTGPPPGRRRPRRAARCPARHPAEEKAALEQRNDGERKLPCPGAPLRLPRDPRDDDGPRHNGYLRNARAVVSEVRPSLRQSASPKAASAWRQVAPCRGLHHGCYCARTACAGLVVTTASATWLLDLAPAGDTTSHPAPKPVLPSPVVSLGFVSLGLTRCNGPFLGVHCPTREGVLR